MQMAAATVFTAARSWQGKLSKPEYRNWLEVGQALSITSDGIRPFIEKGMKDFQRKVTAKLVSSRPCTCTHVPRRRPTPWHNLCVCAWAFEFQLCHNKRNPTWNQSDNTKWTDPDLGYWEIAKLFMPELGSQAKDVVDASTTDPTGLLNLIEWCSVFTIQRSIIKRVRGIRNTKWGHAPQQELSDAERNDAFQAMRDLLEDPALVTDPDAQKALAEIAALETSDIVNFEEIEIKVLRDKINSTREDVIAKVDQLKSQTNLEAEQTRRELSELKTLIKYYISKKGTEELSEDDEIEIREILEALEPSLSFSENISRLIISNLLEIFLDSSRHVIVCIATFPLLIFLSLITKKKAVFWIAWLCCLQSLRVLDDRPALPYRTLGCFKDTANRAIPTLEGQDPLLDGRYPARQNAIAKCYQTAKKRGFKVFSIQNGGWCASSLIAQLTYDKYGASSACGSDGEGGGWANQVYVIQGYDPEALPYQTLGCFKDTANRAIPTLEGQDPLLDETYPARQNTITKCYQAAKKRGFKVFALQNGGWCASSATAELTYHKYGASSACASDGEGGGWANQVYVIQGYDPEALPYQTLGCFKDTANRAVPTLEGQDPLLDGSYTARQNAITKCYQAAKKRGFKVFAVQNGGRCASSATAELTYRKYGASSACASDGEGGGWANQVYVIH